VWGALEVVEWGLQVKHVAVACGEGVLSSNKPAVVNNEVVRAAYGQKRVCANSSSSEKADFGRTALVIGRRVT